MKTKTTILIFILGILTIPILSILELSFQNNNGNIFKWYLSVLFDEEFKSAFMRSCTVSVLVAALGVIFSFIISLSWFDKRQFIVVLTLILIIGLLPPDISAISIIKVQQMFGIYSSNYFILVLGLIYYILPFSVILFWTTFYYIDPITLIAAKDIGLKNIYVIIRIIFPLSKMTSITCFILSFLLAFNEYPRTYFLSGTSVLLSEYLNGKLNSGADESIYAGGSLTIIMTASMIFVYSMILVFKKDNNDYSQEN